MNRIIDSYNESDIYSTYGGVNMSTETTRYTTTIPIPYLEELRILTKEKRVKSMNYAIVEAISDYLDKQKSEQYHLLLSVAGRDEAFLARTLNCSDDFALVDGEDFESC